MEQKYMIPTTQRAYTLRLRGYAPQDASWRENLWKTHEAVNKGAKAFGDWLLTLRGGLSHELVEIKVKMKSSKRNPNDDEKRDRRILLALSWLSVESSVESEKDASKGHIVQCYTDEQTGRRTWKTVDALKEILKSRGLNNGEIDQWVNDCSASLSAAIRHDAVWVNRSKAFDELCNGQDMAKARKDAQTLLWFLLSDDYLALPRKAKKEKNKEVAGAEDEQESSEEEIKEEKQNAAIQSGKGAGQRTRHPFSHIFGFKEDSEGFGKGKQKIDLKDYWKHHLKPRIDGSGIPLLETKQKKNNGASPTELHREMFSKAASRLAQIHTKQKQQELEREQRKAADEELKKLASDTAYKDAISKLKEYCERYEEGSGSLSGFQIQPRQITKWETVVEKWSKITEDDTDAAEEKRIEEAKRLQEELRDEKFGDINLFIRLSEDEYKPVWWHNSKADASILKTFVKGMKARADAEFLKVAAYRHPDPYFNPVFCQFGVSRPAIEFKRLDPSAGEDVRTVKMLTWNGQKADRYSYLAVSKHFDADIGSICESMREGSTKSLVSRRDRLNLSVIGSDKENVRVVHVFDRKVVRKRKKDNESVNTDVEKSNEKEPEWNGTLQADRRDLEKVGELLQTDKIKAENLLKKLNWSLIVSMELQPQGPWIEYITNATDKSPFERTYQSGVKKGQGYISFTGWPLEAENKNREGMARLILSRIPGLRLLSVDLGHRYAAACAVWETISSEEMLRVCEKAALDLPKANDLYLLLKSHDGKKTTIYRRIGSDTVEEIDKNTGESREAPHPTPWARLDRQFLIKLQGEEHEPRIATAEEIWKVHELEKELCRSMPLIDRLVKAGWGKNHEYPYQQKILRELEAMGWKTIEGQTDFDKSITRRQSLSVDDLMSSAVDTVRLALRHHGDRARIAYAIKAEYKTLPGVQKYWFIPQRGDTEEKKKERQQEYEKFMLQALMLWHGLATGKKYYDSEAREMWNKHLVALGAPKIGDPSAAKEEDAEDLPSAERKKRKKELEKKLGPVAQKLAQNEPVHMKLRVAWATLWRKEDGRQRFEDVLDSKNKPTGKKIDHGTCTGWHDRLKQLNNWILPRGIRKVHKDADGKWVKETQWDRLKDSMNVGGLSFTRIATIKSLYQVQKAYRMRPDPDDLRKNVPAKGDDAMRNFGQSILDTLERMRENHVKQLASRIAEAALGIGIEQEKINKKDLKRPRERINNPRFATCHVVVVENLTHYRPEETRTRRENRQLMDWSAAKVKKYLSEACELNGLHLREVHAGYTSRQDSRTGAPGIRCVDVSVKEFLNSPFWKAEVKRAEKNVANNKGVDARSRYLTELKKKFESCNFDDKMIAPLRIPHKGGEIFVSAYSGKGLQADLNAAANIGLKALLDPDWPGSWWYVPADIDKDGWRIPKVKSCNGAACLKLWKVAPKDKSFSKDGRPLGFGNDESVKKAEDECQEAKAAWDTAKKAVNAAKKGKTELNMKNANQQLELAKEAHEAAKKKIFIIKKAGKAKPTINLWRDIFAHPLIEGEWLEYSDYWKKYVPDKVVGILRKQAGLDPDDIPF